METLALSAFFDELEKIGEHSPYGRQLKMGEKVEEEHKGTIGWLKTHPKSPLKAATRSIASDHLDEDKKYYTHLKEMENKYQGKGGEKGGALTKASIYAAEQTGEGGDPMQTSGGTVRG